MEFSRRWVKRRLLLIQQHWMRRRLKNEDFSIIASNCWSGRIYQELGIEYATPFAGLFLYAPCYLKLLGSLRESLISELVFVAQSKYPEANQYRERTGDHYPIGVLEEDIEVHFLHYENENEAREKWTRRLDRIQWDNLFIAFTERDLCEAQHIGEFLQLPYQKKVLFSAKKYSPNQDIVWIKEDEQAGEVLDILHSYKNYFDVIDWLNGGHGELGKLHSFINRFFYSIEKL